MGNFPVFLGKYTFVANACGPLDTADPPNLIEGGTLCTDPDGELLMNMGLLLFAMTSNPTTLTPNSTWTFAVYSLPWITADVGTPPGQVQGPNIVQCPLGYLSNQGPEGQPAFTPDFSLAAYMFFQFEWGATGAPIISSVPEATPTLLWWSYSPGLNQPMTNGYVFSVGALGTGDSGTGTNSPAYIASLFYYGADPPPSVQMTPVTGGRDLQFHNFNLGPKNLMTDLQYVDFRGCFSSQLLAYADVTGANLSGMDLSGWEISGPLILQNADLSGVILPSGVDLSQATFTGVNLTGVDLSQVKLPSNADFTGANLAGVTFADGVDLSQATFVGANLSNVIFDSVQLPANPNFTGCNLSGASFYGVDLSGANFTSVTAYGATFEYANLASTTWSSAFCGAQGVVCTLTSPASGDATTLNNGSLPGDLATLMENAGINLAGNPPVNTRTANANWSLTIEGGTTYYIVAQAGELIVLANTQTAAKFDNAFFVDAVLDNGNFAQASFQTIVWTGDAATANQAVFDEANFGQAIVISATPQFPSFAGATLFGTQFASAILVNANLQGAGFSATDTEDSSFKSANLFATGLANSDLDGADLSGAIVCVSATGASPAFYGAPLFILSSSLESSLVGGPASPSVLAAFKSAGYALPSATITEVTASLQWTISAPQPNWSEGDSTVLWYQFTILLASDELIVYGTSFIVFPPLYGGDSPNKNAFIFIAGPPMLTSTGQPVWLTETDMSGTTCPNGLLYSQNQTLHNSWDQDALANPAEPSTDLKKT